MNGFELPLGITLHCGDTLTYSWIEYGEGDTELVDYRVIPSPLREAAAIAELRKELEALGHG